MLWAIKEASTLVFAPLKISDPTIFTSPARKQDDPEMKRLLMKDGSYHCLSPILFTNPDQISPEGFLRSPVLTNIIRLLISSRTALTGEKARGGPKARGQIYGVHSVTEGLAHYLLTPDTELQAVSSETKIPYEGDYDFYLERLYKRSTWVIETMNFFNIEVFGNNKAREKSSKPTVPSAPLRTWEDDFLEDLDNAGSPARTTTSTSAIAHLNFTGNSSVPGLSPPRSPRHSPLLSRHRSPPHPSHSLPPGPGSISHPDLPGPPYLPPRSVNDPPESSVATSNAMVSIHNYPGALSAVSQLQVEVGQMSISGTQNIQMGSDQTSSTRKVSSHRTAPIPAQLPESSVPPVNSKPLVQECVTRARTKAPK
ncbi:hypothetical protein BDN67DRAFT_1015591 [Paxillus ammoniavirescens]|nr:hypothetical protein BDN67DRAFT_1015591 [Paxillus ammoniavirescens]